MLVDLRDTVQKEIARGATEDQAGRNQNFLSTNRCRDTNPEEKSRAADVPGNDGHA